MNGDVLVCHPLQAAESAAQWEGSSTIKLIIIIVVVITSVITIIIVVVTSVIIGNEGISY